MEGRRVKRVDGTKRLQKFLDLYREATSISLVPCSERHRFRQPDNINETDTEKEVQWLCRRRFPKTMVLANEAMLGTMQNKLLQLMDKRGLSHAPMRRPKELFEHVRFTCTSRFEELVYFCRADASLLGTSVRVLSRVDLLSSSASRFDYIRSRGRGEGKSGNEIDSAEPTPTSSLTSHASDVFSGPFSATSPENSTLRMQVALGRRVYWPSKGSYQHCQAGEYVMFRAPH
ncbi:hypothetical protein CPB85DRAFT_1023060 [Mucidula mucida]|nr:hypothetical protein CPB85DRAFT_1023060 [Mucidula mucida]